MTQGSRRRLTAEQAEKFLVDATPWMSCDECFEHLDEFVDLPDPAGAELHDWVPAMLAHLAGCGACREEVDSLRILLENDP